MKKKLIVLLLTLTATLLLTSAALAEDPVTKCPYCGAANFTYALGYADATYNHTIYCQSCGRIVRAFEQCTPLAGSAADCYYPEICSVCKHYLWNYGVTNPDNHRALTDWLPLNAEEHYRYCTTCNAESSYEYASHSGGDFSCDQWACCAQCNLPYGEPLGHGWSQWQPNGDGTHTRVCKNDATHIETDNCTLSNWTLLTHNYHERRCSVCNNQELGEHTGGSRTCSAAPVCDVCHESYGAPDRTLHPNPTYETKSATCFTDGYIHIICDEPGCCQPFTEFILPARGQHLYQDWQPLGDGSHTGSCQSCGEALTVACTTFEMDSFKVCPICGGYEGGVLPVLYARDDDEALPYGTLVVRGGEIPVDGALFAITVTGSYYGEVVELQRTVTISIPMALDGFRVLSMAGADIPFTLEDGMLTFTAEAVDLFLLVPAE